MTVPSNSITLLYADDIVFISSSAASLQTQLDTLNNWSRRWRLNVNIDKTKVLHVRKATVARSEFVFKIGDKIVDYTSQYRYLGLTVSETLDYNISVNELITGSSRALGSLVSKYYSTDGFDYDTYTKLFESTVAPIMTYCAGVWGFKAYEGLDKLQNRAIRSFLGVGKFTPIPGMTGEMAWIPVSIRNHCQMIKLWCRIVNMHSERLPSRIYAWDCSFSRNHKDTWYNNIKSIMNESGLDTLFNSKCTDGLSTKFISNFAKDMLMQKYQITWEKAVEAMPKLRTYRDLNTTYSVQPYLKSGISRHERSAIARLRCGVFPLEIEKGRYRGVPADRRLCKVCRTGSVEDEKHFLLHCPTYSLQRNRMFMDCQQRYNCNFDNMSDMDKFKFLLSAGVKIVSKFITNISDIRTQTLMRKN
ncbi:unnamed protein product [Mytilus edulis]|uniref:Reverse transcriptase domain-containing protein n=1 Tax=Mytilus edulis TaxID=6550 RepID=A0A8S3PWW2_MYTED|nr:unnamed protein product [Mytilus edulis]